MKGTGRFVLCLFIHTVMGLKMEVPRLKMNNGLLMPAVALGTYLGFDQNGIMLPKDNQVRDLVSSAIDIGWRHFDTAAIYGTEKQVGEGVQMKIKDGTVKREDIFITTKLWNTHHKREEVPLALKESLNKLGMNYVDLYLIHWPIGLHRNNSESPVDYVETWRGMEDVLKLGLAKSIGVSNFNKYQLSRLLKEGSVKPAALQIEVHPQIVQKELVDFAQSQDIVVMGYSPFGSLVNRYGMNLAPPRIDDPTLVSIAQKYGKSTPQVVLRWAVDRNIVPIPKTVTTKRLEENINIFDFKLTKEEIDKINAFDRSIRYTLPSFWQNHPYYPFEKVENPVADIFAKKDKN